jgi:hypothetical protein
VSERQAHAPAAHCRSHTARGLPTWRQCTRSLYTNLPEGNERSRPPNTTRKARKVEGRSKVVAVHDEGRCGVWRLTLAPTTMSSILRSVCAGKLAIARIGRNATLRGLSTDTAPLTSSAPPRRPPSWLYGPAICVRSPLTLTASSTLLV